MEYIVVKDRRRKKMIMTVEKDGSVVICAPKRMGRAAIDNFYKSNIEWVKQQQAKVAENKDQYIQLSDKDIAALKKQAKTVMAQKTEHYASVMGVCPQSVKITSAQKKWASCTKKDEAYSINYSWRTMLLPEEVQDYIVVHELAHMKQFNHSNDFYAEIEKVMPNWKELEKQADNFNDIYQY